MRKSQALIIRFMASPRHIGKMGLIARLLPMRRKTSIISRELMKEKRYMVRAKKLMKSMSPMVRMDFTKETEAMARKLIMEMSQAMARIRFMRKGPTTRRGLMVRTDFMKMNITRGKIMAVLRLMIRNRNIMDRMITNRNKPMPRLLQQ